MQTSNAGMDSAHISNTSTCKHTPSYFKKVSFPNVKHADYNATSKPNTPNPNCANMANTAYNSNNFASYAPPF